MEVKAFHLQAPEAIAKEYGGNKQKIGQAMQAGLLDPTAAVLAGMFIDRMRTAQTQEMQPQQTIAQQVFNPASPPSPAPPMNAPQGMAEGGLAALPVPDGMFDEPADAESFAGGGIVAFQKGGLLYKMGDKFYNTEGREIERPNAPGYNYIEAERVPTLEGAVIRPKYGAVETRLGQFTPAAKTRMSMAEYAAALRIPRGAFGASASAPAPAPATPAPSTPAPVAPTAASSRPTTAPARPTRGLGAIAPATASAAPTTAIATSDFPMPTAEDINALTAGLPNTREEAIKQVQDSYNLGPTPARDRLMQQIQASVAPEATEKQRKRDTWMALAQIGFGMAGTQSHNFLQAFGNAAAAALPGIQASANERRALQRDALKSLADMENMDRAEKRDFIRQGLDNFEKARDLRQRALTFQTMTAQEQRKFQEDVRQFNERLAFEGREGAADRASRAASSGGEGERGLTQMQTISIQQNARKELAEEYRGEWRSMTPAQQSDLVNRRLAEYGIGNVRGSGSGASAGPTGNPLVDKYLPQR